MSAAICGERLVVPINRDGDILGCRELEAHPDFVASVTRAICGRTPVHAGDHDGVRRITGQIRDEVTSIAPRNAVTVTVHITAGDPEPGHWCDTCLLPSAAELPIHGLHHGGVIELGRIRACPDCGQLERV